MKLLIYCIPGFIVGAMMVSIYQRVRTSFGSLEIDQSNSEKDVYRLVIDDLDNLSNKKYVRLRINRNADLSQK